MTHIYMNSLKEDINKLIVLENELKTIQNNASIIRSEKQILKKR